MNVDWQSESEKMDKLLKMRYETFKTINVKKYTLDDFRTALINVRSKTKLLISVYGYKKTIKFIACYVIDKLIGRWRKYD